MERNPGYHSDDSDDEKKFKFSLDMFGGNKEAAEEKEEAPKRVNLFEALLKHEETPKKEEVSPNEKQVVQPEQEIAEAEELEKISLEEIKEIVAMRGEAVDVETAHAPEASPEKAEAAGASALLEAANEKLEEGKTLEEALEEAEAETIEQLGLEEIAAELADEPDEDMAEDESVATAATTSPTNVAPSSAVPPVSVGIPVPPLPPIGSSPPGSGPPLGPSFGAAAGNIFPITPNVAPATPDVLPSRRNRSADLLVGGIVGYLIGKRRGRVKTEARLLPIQQKLEHQVRDLSNQIDEHENKIRRLVAKKIEKTPEAIRLSAAEKTEARLFKKPEIKATKATQRNLEKLGNVLIPKPEKTPEAKKDIATFTLPELLEIAAKVEVGGVSLKVIYESGRIDAVGLRRTVGDYLKGGDYTLMLSRELLAAKSPERLASEAASPQPIIASAGGGNDRPDPQLPIVRAYDPKPTLGIAHPPTAVPTMSLTTPTKAQNMKEQIKGPLITLSIIFIAIALLLVVFR